MRVPLLIAFCPRTSVRVDGPYVRIPPGRWSFEGEGIHDTKVELHLNDQRHEGDFEGPCEVRAIVLHRGTEDYISVFVRRNA